MAVRRANHYTRQAVTLPIKDLFKVSFNFFLCEQPLILMLSLKRKEIIITEWRYFQGCMFGIVVSTSDCHPRGPGFDSRLYPRHFSGSIGSGSGSTQPREDDWVAT